MNDEAMPPGAPERQTAQGMSAALVALIRAMPVASADLDAAALFTLDAAANMIAGRATEPGRILLDWARMTGITGRNATPDAGRLALIHGALCHILEVDDLHRASVVHPGCVVVPVVFALAATGGKDISGHTALKAVLHGFEAAARIGRAVGPSHYRIWHNTATCGPFGAGLAAAQLLGLDDAQCADALGNAGTQAAGLWEFLDSGAMSKHLHAGRACEAGLVSAQLAACGFTGAPHILEGERGFFRAFCADGEIAKVLSDAGAPWQLHETSIKPWPSCRHTHPAIEVAGQVRRQMAGRSLNTDEIEAIDIAAYQAAIDLCDRARVDSTYAAKFSLQHCVAAALSEANVDFASFDTAARKRLDALRKRATVHHDETLERAYPLHWGGRISVTLASGEVLSAETADAKGDPEAPLDREQIVAKAHMLMRHGRLDEPQPLIDAILAMGDNAPVPVLAL